MAAQASVWFYPKVSLRQIKNFWKRDILFADLNISNVLPKIAEIPYVEELTDAAVIGWKNVNDWKVDWKALSLSLSLSLSFSLSFFLMTLSLFLLN